MGVLEKGYDATLGRLNHGYRKLLAVFLRRRLDLVMGWSWASASRWRWPSRR